MRTRPCVTVFASDAGHKGAEGQLFIHDRACRVAAEAGYRFVGREPSSYGFVEGFRGEIEVADGDSEPSNGRIVADEAFVVDAVALKHPSLRAIAKRPADRESYGSSSVGYGILALTILRLHSVGVAKFLKRQSGVGIQYRIGARRLQSARHKRVRLTLRLGRVAMSAGLNRILPLFLGQPSACGE